MPDEYNRLVEIEEQGYRETLAWLTDLERQARMRGVDRAHAEFREQNKAAGVSNDSTAHQEDN